MSSSRRAVALAAFAALVSCSRRPETPALQRVAIVPFENLSGDSSLDWAGPAVAHVLAKELAGAPRFQPVPADRPDTAQGLRATHLLSGYLTREQGRIRATGVLTVLATNRRDRTVNAAGDAIIPVADAAARAIHSSVPPYGTRNDAALRLLVDGKFEAAASADPGYGEAWTSWIGSLAARGDRAGALRAAAAAKQQGDRLPASDRARIDYLDAALRSDAAAQTEALARIATLYPSDTEVLRRLGGLALNARRYSAAAGWFRKATQADPQNGVLWNDLGYALAFARDLEGATKALREYEKTSPGQANPHDSLGEVLFYFGRFDDAAAAFLEAWKRDPAFLNGATLLKAARSRLHAGDPQAAGELYSRFEKSHQDPAAGYRGAQWDYLTGRRDDAAGRMKEIAARASGDAAAQALSQLSLWALAKGDRAAASSLAGRAFAASQGPQAKALAWVCRFVSEASSTATEWKARADRAFAAAPPLRAAALSYALLFDRKFAEAAGELRTLFDQTPPDRAGPVKVLLAWALVETGKAGEARDYLETWPIPLAGVEPSLEFVIFPRIFRLRSAVLQNQGDKRGAEEAIALYRKYGGE